MPSFGSLSIATSGMRAAQVNLAVTGHNVANSELPGYSRQRIVQNTSFSSFRGVANSGHYKKVGMGTDWTAIHQIRNEFLDFSYRQNVGRLSFYAQKVQTGLVLESLIGELYGAYNFQSVLNDMWFAIQELTSNPSGIETRQLFLATVNSFLNKAQDVYEGLFEYQLNLDAQVRATVADVNAIIADIERLNRTIRKAESMGENANDFRDERNLQVDRLSELIPLDVFSAPNGDVIIFSQGHELLANGTQTNLGLRFVSPEFSFVEVVLTPATHILPANTPPDEFIAFTNYRRPINNATGNDLGRLNALLLSRGTAAKTHMCPDRPQPERTDFPAGADYDYRYHAAMHNWNAHMWSVNNATIPRVQIQLDKIVHQVVRMVNDAVTGGLREPNPEWTPSDPPEEQFRYVFRNDDGSRRIPLDADGNPGNGIPLFVRQLDIITGRTGEEMWYDLYTDPDATSINTKFTIRNLRINPAFLETDGHNRLALSLSGAPNDTDLLEALHHVWASGASAYGVSFFGGDPLGIQDAYIRMTGSIATKISEANSFVTAQTTLVLQSDSLRQSVKGVSMDEELNAMLRFQFAFQAASRAFNVIDSMIDQVVNRTGRVGL
jgi:flagellar hook-associated protein 1 FlgK